MLSVEAEYTVNVIAQNMYAQCDKDGNQNILLKSITDHKTDGHAVEKADAYITVKGRNPHSRPLKDGLYALNGKTVQPPGND